MLAVVIVSIKLLNGVFDVVAVMVDDRILAFVFVKLVDEVVKFGLIELIIAVNTTLVVSRKNVESDELDEPLCLLLNVSVLMFKVPYF